MARAVKALGGVLLALNLCSFSMAQLQVSGWPFAELYIGLPHGYVYRASYFTAPEVRDSRWEERRLVSARGVRICAAGHRLLRRDVRWYPANAHSGRRCAAIVYTMQCADDDPSEAGTEQDRRYEFRLDADPPIGRNCRADPYPDPAIQSAAAEAQLVLPRDFWPHCAEPDIVPRDPLWVFDETRIYLRTRLQLDDPSRTASSVQYAFTLAQMIMPRVNSSPVPNNGTHIIITRGYGVGPSEHDYCEQLTAQQGARIWRRTITRSGDVEHLRQEVGVTRDGRSRDPTRYWTPQGDARELALSLGAYLAAHADPVYREGRGRVGR